ncbi:MAG: adenylate/guanylate cyclase domain-containing protein [Chlamydiae bacterium]|nr:adenylate/guanylate cyclase domain-containing protein [Chlamydiota bacterium]MBI3266723.1 adenylate/guanylate cyclase domain-containing protein [Chlamydiota bacterium]
MVKTSTQTLKNFNYRWAWQFKSSPEELWPLVSDTNRFNFEMGMPPLSKTASNGKRVLSFSRLGIKMTWEEIPFEWVRPYRFGVIRRYCEGPLEEMRIHIELLPLSNSQGTEMVCQIGLSPKRKVRWMLLFLPIEQRMGKSFEKIFRGYDVLLIQENLSSSGSTQKPKRVKGSEKRLNFLKENLLKENVSADLVNQLIKLVEWGDDLTVRRMRPYVFADHWHVSRKTVLELFLLATRTGLLEMSWDLLCPMCRGSSESHSHLDEIKTHSHCDGCNMDFTINFDRLVELTFKPNPSIRQAEGKLFCLGGPQMTPHVMLQQSLLPGEKRSVQAMLEKGRYRLRTCSVPGAQYLNVEKEGASEIFFTANSRGWSEKELSLTREAKISLENQTDRPQTFFLERTKWSDQAATAAEVIALQRFRDLFSEEVLRPGEHVSVGSISILFTDLKGSTRLYREVGDAPAFGLVMNHFDVLKEAILAEDGAIVKTIGDAVMAVFKQPLGALKAAFEAEKKLASPPTGTKPLFLKVGLHYGHAIAINLNERLDYFGSTVNLAARLGALSKGQDVIVSDSIYRDPEVSEWIRSEPHLQVESVKALLKGFEEEHFDLWRVAVKKS